jgi:hypothetical protein
MQYNKFSKYFYDMTKIRMDIFEPLQYPKTMVK